MSAEHRSSGGERDGGADSGADSGADGDDWREWLLVGVIVLSFVVIPGLVLLNPPALPFRVAYLLLPLIPAVLLGATAVWVALRRGSP